MKPKILFFICLVAVGCSKWHTYELDGRSFNQSYLDMIQTNIGIKLPPGASGSNLYYYHPQFHPSFIAKIGIPAGEMDSVVKQMEEIPNKDWHFTNPLSKNVSWWKSSDAQSRIKRQFVRPDSGFVEIELCTNANWAGIYVYWDAD